MQLSSMKKLFHSEVFSKFPSCLPVRQHCIAICKAQKSSLNEVKSPGSKKACLSHYLNEILTAVKILYISIPRNAFSIYLQFQRGRNFFTFLSILHISKYLNQNMIFFLNKFALLMGRAAVHLNCSLNHLFGFFQFSVFFVVAKVLGFVRATFRSLEGGRTQGEEALTM